MPENDHRMPEGALLRVTGCAERQTDSVRCSVQRLREDITLVTVPDADTARLTLCAECDEAALVLAFHVPRTGKGGEGALPAGAMQMLPPGINALPGLSGRGLLLCLTASRLAAILGPDMETLPAGVHALLRREDEMQGPVAVPLTPEQILAGNALIGCAYTGAVRNIFFKSKMLELLALFFHSLALQREGTPALSAQEQRSVTEAREFLLSSLENPPAIRDIARHAGVNEKKLKRLFKEAYGLSPYAYLHRERMAAAREMLLNKGANVSEAAMHVGYTNISHFISAFSRRYGVRPGELLTRKTK